MTVRQALRRIRRIPFEYYVVQRDKKWPDCIHLVAVAGGIPVKITDNQGLRTEPIYETRRAIKVEIGDKQVAYYHFPDNDLLPSNPRVPSWLKRLLARAWGKAKREPVAA